MQKFKEPTDRLGSIYQTTNESNDVSQNAIEYRRMISAGEETKQKNVAKTKKDQPKFWNFGKNRGKRVEQKVADKLAVPVKPPVN